MNGVIVVNKPSGYTSRDIVNIISKEFNTRKVGHTGTLDPMATGVLVIVMGNCTKLVDYLTSTEKTYEAEVTLGIDTDTLDITGTILKEECVNTDDFEVDKALKELTGSYLQEVPAYSAKTINGRKLYDYARCGEKVILPMTEVSIKELKRTSDLYFKDSKVLFNITTVVSKGTYIRSLIRDIAFKLKTVGVMSSLKRTKQGNFTLDDAYTLESIKTGVYKLITLKEILSTYPTAIVDAKLAKTIKNGNIIEDIYHFPKIVLQDTAGNILAIYKTYSKQEGMLKPDIMF